MRRWSLLAAVLLAPVVSAAIPLPLTIAKPPPGTLAGTTECRVGRSHGSSSYDRDLGCMLGNLTMACMAESPPDVDWMLTLADAAYELARRSTAITRSERSYLV